MTCGTPTGVRDLDRPVGVLSVGQRRRLALALLIAQAPNLMLLDEPTNHISLALAEELEEALRRAPGAVVVASHDRWLRGSWSAPRLGLTADHRILGREPASRVHRPRHLGRDRRSQ